MLNILSKYFKTGLLAAFASVLIILAELSRVAFLSNECSRFGFTYSVLCFRFVFCVLVLCLALLIFFVFMLGFIYLLCFGFVSEQNIFSSRFTQTAHRIIRKLTETRLSEDDAHEREVI